LNRRIRIGIILALIGVVLAGVGIFVVFSLFKSIVAPPPAPTPPPVATRPVVIASRDLALGVLFRVEDLTTIDVPVELAPRDAIGDPTSIVGRISKVPLVGGEMVLNHHLADPTNVNRDIAYVLDDSMVLMAFPATDLMSSLSLIERGDVIDILASMNQEAPVTEARADGQFVRDDEETVSRLFTFSAMQRVGITATVVEIVGEQPAPVEGGGPQQPANTRTRAYLLALNPQDALLLKHLKDAGATFDYVLRAPSSTALFELQPVISEYLIEKYELEVTR
jgi:pilus assembly protein CpaB